MHPPILPPILSGTPARLTCQQSLVLTTLHSVHHLQPSTHPSSHHALTHLSPPKHLSPVPAPQSPYTAPSTEPHAGVPRLVIHRPPHLCHPSPNPFPQPLYPHCSLPLHPALALPEPLSRLIYLVSTWPHTHPLTAQQFTCLPTHPATVHLPPGRQPTHLVTTTPSLYPHIQLSTSRVRQHLSPVPLRHVTHRATCPSIHLLQSFHPLPTSPDPHPPVHPPHTPQWTLRPGPVSPWGADLDGTPHPLWRSSHGPAQDPSSHKGRHSQPSWEGHSALT